MAAFVLIIIIVASALVFSISSLTAEGSSYYFKSVIYGNTSAEPGEDYTIYISAEDIGSNGLASFIPRLEFDSSKLELASVSLFSAPTENSWECGGRIIGGVYEINVFDDSAKGSVSKDGELVVAVKFKVNEKASGSLNFNIVGCDGSYFVPGGLVEVKGEPSSFKATVSGGEGASGETSELQPGFEDFKDNYAITGGFLYCAKGSVKALTEILSQGYSDISFLPDGGVIKTGLGFKALKKEVGILALKTVVLGDINGDGDISSSDYIRAKLYFSKGAALGKAELAAADFDFDGGVTVTDAMILKQYLTSGYSLSLPTGSLKS